MRKGRVNGEDLLFAICDQDTITDSLESDSRLLQLVLRLDVLRNIQLDRQILYNLPFKKIGTIEAFS